MHKRLTILLAAPLALLFVTGTALAGPGHGPIGKGQLDPKACDAVGKTVIDVTQKVLNDADSGQAGNAWAFDTYNRHIQVWQNDPTDSTSWCAVVTYDGAQFAAIEGATSPGSTVLGAQLIGANVKGNFSGGYRATFNGTLLAAPLWKTHGNVGTFNYACDTAFNCPGYVDWVGQYFGTGYTNFAQPWWGWSYNATGHHGSWVNEIPPVGNSGDIF